MFSLVRNVSVNSPENQHIAKASTTLEDFDIDARQVQSFQSPQLCDRFTHDAQVLANGGGKVWNLLFPIRVFTQHASKIKGFGSKFACKSASAFCLNWAIVYYHLNNDLECPQRQSKHVKFVWSYHWQNFASKALIHGACLGSFPPNITVLPAGFMSVHSCEALGLGSPNLPRALVLYTVTIASPLCNAREGHQQNLSEFSEFLELFLPKWT